MHWNSTRVDEGLKRGGRNSLNGLNWNWMASTASQPARSDEWILRLNFKMIINDSFYIQRVFKVHPSTTKIRTWLHREKINGDNRICGAGATRSIGSCQWRVLRDEIDKGRDSEVTLVCWRRTRMGNQLSGQSTIRYIRYLLRGRPFESWNLYLSTQGYVDTDDDGAPSGLLQYCCWYLSGSCSIENNTRFSPMSRVCGM